jgi:ABC-type phosphate transport system auxiliary subunit
MSENEIDELTRDYEDAQAEIATLTAEVERLRVLLERASWAIRVMGKCEDVCTYTPDDACFCREICEWKWEQVWEGGQGL